MAFFLIFLTKVFSAFINPTIAFHHFDCDATWKPSISRFESSAKCKPQGNAFEGHGGQTRKYTASYGSPLKLQLTYTPSIIYHTISNNGQLKDCSVSTYLILVTLQSSCRSGNSETSWRKYERHRVFPHKTERRLTWRSIGTLPPLAVYF